MDKHRSRLPVLYVRKHDILKVKWADNDSKYISINKEMRKELKKIYDDSEIESINSWRKESYGESDIEHFRKSYNNINVYCIGSCSRMQEKI